MSFARLIHYGRALRSSYWFLPSFMVVGALGLSFVVSEIDERWGVEWIGQIDFLVASRPEGARAVLSAIAGSMITVAGVTFSMTMVSVSYAAAQFGPRLVGNFMRDTGNQITLGVFIATFVYCLMILRTVRSADPAAIGQSADAFVPQISILVALGLALACVGVLIYFIHHVPETINVGNITAAVGRELVKDVETLFPDSIGEEAASTSEEASFSATQHAEAKPLLATTDGYVQSLDADCISQISVDQDLIVRLQYRPGDFVVRGDALLLAWPEEHCPKEVIESLAQTFVLGTERTPSQNVLFLVDELVEIMSRALSPGMNDPFTAISCIRWLSAGLRRVSERTPPPACRYDSDGNLRLIAYPVSFERFASSIFDQSLQYVSADRNAALEMMRLVGEAAVVTIDKERRAILLRHAENLLHACDTRLPLETDRHTVRTRFDELHRALESEQARIELQNDQGWLNGSA